MSDLSPDQIAKWQQTLASRDPGPDIGPPSVEEQASRDARAKLIENGPGIYGPGGMYGNAIAAAEAPKRNLLGGWSDGQERHGVDPSALVQSMPVRGPTGADDAKSANGVMGAKKGVLSPFAGAGGGGAPVDWESEATKSLGMGGDKYARRSLQAQSADRRALEQKDTGAQLAFQNGQDAAAYGEGVAAHYNDIQARQAQAREQQSDMMKQQFDKVDRLSQAVGTDKIDPDRYWKDKDMGAKFFAILGAALGGAGAALSHTQNDALNMLNASIARDIDAQKSDIATRRGRVEDAKGLYSMYRQEGLDEQTSTEAAKGDYLKLALLKGDALAQRSQSKTVLQNWAEQRAQIEASIAHQGQAVQQSIGSRAWQLQHAPAGAPSKTQEDLDKFEDESAYQEQAIRDLKPDAEGNVSGMGFGGRLLHAIAPITEKVGADLESDEAKRAYAAKDVLEGNVLKKGMGSRVNAESLGRADRNYKNSADATHLSALAAERLRAERDRILLHGRKGTKTDKTLDTETDVGDDK